MPEPSTAWNEGRAAAEAGKEPIANPYVEMTEAFEDWNEGFDNIHPDYYQSDEYRVAMAQERRYQGGLA